MRALLIGDIKKIDEMYHWFEVATEYFEINLIISENELESKYYTCSIEPISSLESFENIYEIIFIFSSLATNIKQILLMRGIDENIILFEPHICRFLSKRDIMNYYAEQIRQVYHELYSVENVQVGEFSYGRPLICRYENETKVSIGKFCSLAAGVTIVMGGEHRTNWCTTYPFNALINDFAYIKGHPASKGDIIIGNDVWLGSDSKILSGVHIGNGCVVSANAVVTKDVEPYTIVGGVPAKIIGKRFDDETIQKLEEIQWWNWDKEYIYDAVPLLQSNDLEQLFKFYDTIVKKCVK